MGSDNNYQNFYKEFIREGNFNKRKVAIFIKKKRLSVNDCRAMTRLLRAPYHELEFSQLLYLQDLKRFFSSESVF